MGTPPSPTTSGWSHALRQTKIVRILAYRDFRLLWIGAFLSFTGSWVQNVAQGHFVYVLTHDESKLALVTFAWSLPVFLFGLIAGSFTDHLNKRTILIGTQVFFAITALYLAISTYWGFVQYWQIVTISFLNGLVACVEMPTRQSIVSRVVPAEDLATAVPINAMTFNVARIFGPALGGVVLATMGVAACYFVNGLSFLALIWSATKIQSDLRPIGEERGPLRDLVMEGALYTWRDRRLRALFLLEGLTAIFGLAYLPLLPAYVQDVLAMSDHKKGLGLAFTVVGIGAFAGLLLVTKFSDSTNKGTHVRLSMYAIGVGLLVASVVRTPWIAMVALGVVGMASIMQLNTTNTLFQLLAPERLRGRVIAMHIWALNGLSPFGVLFFGWLANATRTATTLPKWLPSTGVPLSFQIGGVFVILGAVAATFTRKGLSGLFVAEP